MSKPNEFDCIHLWPQMPDFTMKPCEHCGAIYEHIQLIDAMEDAFEAYSKAEGSDVKECKEDRIRARANVLEAMRKAVGK